MLRSWWAWGITTFFMALYVAVARIEGTPIQAPIELRPGNEIELPVFRVFAQEMSSSLSYRNECVRLPDGAFDPLWNTYRELPGHNVYTPAPMIRLQIGSGDRNRVLYEALPNRNCGRILRHLTANLAIAPGVYLRPPPVGVPGLSLDRFRNNLHIKVAEVDPQMLGRTVEVSVLPPPGFTPHRVLLWFSPFLELIFGAFQSIWLICLLAAWWWSIQEKAG